MDDKKTGKLRLAELMDKINYAENARDYYKERHPILSETNSFYIDALKEELRSLVFSEKE